MTILKGLVICPEDVSDKMLSRFWKFRADPKNGPKESYAELLDAGRKTSLERAISELIEAAFEWERQRISVANDIRLFAAIKSLRNIQDGEKE